MVLRNGNWTNKYVYFPFLPDCRLSHQIRVLVGGLLITKTNDMLSVFYIATAGHLIIALLVWFILPESLSPEVRAAHASAREAAKLSANGEEFLTGQSGLMGSLQRLFSGMFAFLAPLKILLPRKKEPGEPGAAQGKRDWNITFIAIGCGLLNSILGMIPFKFQYAEAQFDWSSETVCSPSNPSLLDLL